MNNTEEYQKDNEFHSEIKAALEAGFQDPGELFFQRQLRRIEEQIQREPPTRRPRRWRWAPFAAAAAIAFLIFGLAKLERRQAPTAPFDWSVAFQYVAEEGDSNPGLSDWEELDTQQLELLAKNLENKILLDEGEKWDEDGIDWEDLNDPELETLIRHLKAQTLGRPT